MLVLMVPTPPNPMPHALDTSLWATVRYLYTEVENAPANKIQLIGAPTSMVPITPTMYYVVQLLGQL